MIKLELTFSTHDELQEAVNRLGGLGDIASTPAATTKAPTNKAKGAAATKAGFTEETAAPAKKKKGAKVPTVEELKAHILEQAGDGEDASQNIKDFVAKMGASKISALTDAQRTKAMEQAEAYFAELAGDADEEGDEEEEDPFE